MTRQIINTGSTANDGTGDTLRSTGTKINANFAEIYSLVGGGSASATRLTDSGLDIIGTNFVTKIGAANPLSELSINFPDSSGEVVINTATQTLTNKTIIEPHITSPIIDILRLHDADSSHYYSLNAGNISSNVIVNLPSITDSDTIVLNKKIATLTNKTLTTPVITKPSIRDWLADSNGNPAISLSSVGSTRNRVYVQGKASGSAPSISTVGSLDTNINLSILAKGSGSVNLSKQSFSTSTAANTSAASASDGLIVLTGTSTGTVTLANGTTSGEIKYFIRRGGTGAVSIAMTSFGQSLSGAGNAGNVDLQANETATLMWDTTTGWNIVGGHGYAIS